MGIKSRMRGPLTDPAEKLYREERAFRASRLVEKWSRVAEIGNGFKNLDASSAKNTAILLENQSRLMSRMTEAQMASSFTGFSPENMLRLVRLSYPNSIRGKLFTEFGMETARDSIKYIRPVYTNSQVDTSMANRTFDENGFNVDGDNDLQGSNYRKAMYESTESRYSTELANGTVDTTAPGAVTLKFDAGPFVNCPYIDGYSTLFINDQTHPLAIQARTGEWFFGNPVAYNGKFYKVSGTNLAGGVYTFNIVASATSDGTYAENTDVLPIKAFGRYDSEGDLTGQYLGEVELTMADYQFRPRPLTLGVTWTQLTELTLDTSFGVSAEELLLDAAGQEIKKALDFNAVKFANSVQKVHASDNVVYFNAEAGASTDDSYFHTAQLVTQAVTRIGDKQLNDILRGGVSRIVGGPAAVTYLGLHKDFTTTGKQDAIGGHQVGELAGIPVFKVPSSIIADNELLTVWKNSQNENDVAIAFGTLLPFYSTGAIQRKNFYKEAGIARFEDQQALQPRYLGRIIIDGIREISTGFGVK